MRLAQHSSTCHSAHPRAGGRFTAPCCSSWTGEGSGSWYALASLSVVDACDFALVPPFQILDVGTAVLQTEQIYKSSAGEAEVIGVWQQWLMV